MNAHKYLSLCRFYWTLASLVASLLTACGGGGASSHQSTVDAVAALPVTRLSASGGETTAVQPKDAPAVVRLEQISATRVDRTRYDYVFALHVRGSGLNIKNASFTAITTGNGSQVLDASARAATINAGRYYVLADTITIRHDRQYPYDPAKLVLDFAGELDTSALASSGPRLGPAAFYVAGGRPGHEGYFKSDVAEPVRGQAVQLRINVLDPAAAATYSLISADGTTISGGDLQRLWAPMTDYTASIVIPAQPFQVRISARAPDGLETTWTSDTYRPTASMPVSFVWSSSSAFRYGSSVSGEIVVNVPPGSPNSTVTLLLPSGFTAETTTWKVTASPTARRIPIAIKTPTEGPHAYFYEIAVTSSTGRIDSQSTAVAQMFAR